MVFRYALHRSITGHALVAGTATILASFARTGVIVPIAGKQYYGEQQHKNYFVEGSHTISAFKIKLF
jgi:hypothetical protein